MQGGYAIGKNHGWAGVNFFRAERPLGLFDSNSKRSSHFASHPQTIERGKLVLLHGSHDMTDAGRTSKGIAQQEGKKGSGENPKENTEGFYFHEQCSYEGASYHQGQHNTPCGPTSCSSGEDGLDIGEVKALVVLGKAIVFYGKNMVIAQVERASGQ